MDVSALSTHYGVSLPQWILDELADVPEVLQTAEERMALVNLLAARNFREGGGGPFAAIVVERGTGKLVSVGVNQVLASNISSAHAEVVALGLAQARRGTWDLGARDSAPTEIVVNWRPCVQCYGAILWAGITHVVIPDDGPDLEQLTGFDEGPMVTDWIEQFRRRGIEVTKGIGRPEALDVFADYADWVRAGNAVLYNARGTGRNV